MRDFWAKGNNRCVPVPAKTVEDAARRFLSRNPDEEVVRIVDALDGVDKEFKRGFIMANDNLTEIVCILDRSGSMGHLTEDTISNFNSFMADQKEVDGDANVTLVLFDDQHEVVYEGMDLDEAPEMNGNIYFTRGRTALHDALGMTIDKVGLRLSEMEEAERPGKVIFLVMTDGMENASQEYTDGKRVAEMVKHQEEKYNWEFVFLGANIDSFGTSQDLGMSRGSASNYDANSRGVREAYAKGSRALKRYRMTGDKGDVNEALSEDDLLDVDDSGEEE